MSCEDLGLMFAGEAGDEKFQYASDLAHDYQPAEG
jgi:hypothetical protein